ncbi:MAG: DUF4139 domain-containing protein [Anaerolineae bacterium]|nr:DUF4139 domain-containing protein [Anaerolineae bacterium]
MVIKRLVMVVVVSVLAVGTTLGFVVGVVSATPDRSDGGIFYESRPDEVALYLNNIAFVRDSVVLPVGQDIRVLLPMGVYANTLILTENGERVQNYRLTPQSADNYYSDAMLSSAAYMGGGTVYILSWETNASAAAVDTREVMLEYLLPGASWAPSYDMTIIDNQSVTMTFMAEITNGGLVLDDTVVSLVAGRVDLSEQLDQVAMVTANQYAVGYERDDVAGGGLGVGLVDLQHVYGLGQVSAQPGDTVYAKLAAGTLNARRLLVWNAATQQETDVIYKVKNETNMPFAEGIVRIYQDGLFRGSDFIETTPIDSEGSVTVGTLPDVRVRRTESQEYHAEGDDYYQHTATLEIHNRGTEDLTLIVLDRWDPQAWDFRYSIEPQREQDNQLRWEVTVAPGESLLITYTFRTDA